MRTSPIWISLLLCAGCNGDLVPATTDATDAPQQAELLGIGISPREPALGVGETVSFSVRAFYADTTNADISDEITWTSTDPRVATIDASGVATAVAPGEAGIVATDSRGAGTRTTLRVRGDGDPPTALTLVPRLVEVEVGDEVELAARATYDDGSAGNLAPTCTWVSEDGAVASVQAGRVRGEAEGRTTVRATCGALEAAAPVTVRSAGAEPDLPDLRVTDLVYEAIDDELWLLFDVVNEGEGMSDVAFVDVFLDTDGPPDEDDEFVTTEIFDALAPGDRTAILLVVEGIAVGDHTAWVVADADGWIAESDEDDNASGPHAFTIAETGGPDLTITTFEGLTDGSYTFYTVEVENVGTETARDFYIDLWYDPSTSPGVCDTGDDFLYVAALAPGDSLTWEPDVLDGPSSGWLSLLWVDSCADVSEIDEGDNQDTVVVSP